MGRPKKILQQPEVNEFALTDDASAQTTTVTVKAVDEGPRSLGRVKAFQMVVGADLIGSRMSMAESRTLTLEYNLIGVKAVSKKSGRHILIPWTNIKGAELYA